MVKRSKGIRGTSTEKSKGKTEQARKVRAKPMGRNQLGVKLQLSLLKIIKKVVYAAYIHKSLLAHQRSMMLGPNPKHRQVTNLGSTLRRSKQAVGRPVAQLKSYGA